MTGAVTMCGALLLCLGVVERRPDFSWIDPDFAEVASQAGEFVPSLIGGALMVCAVAMSQRVTLAWGTTIAPAAAGRRFTVAQGEPLWIPGVLVLAAVLIAPFRTRFYRHARLLPGRWKGGGGAAADAGRLHPGPRRVRAACALAGRQFLVGGGDLAPTCRIRCAPRVAFTVALALLALWRLLRPGRVRLSGLGRADARLRYAALGADPPAEADGIVWGEAERAGIPFRRTGRVLLGWAIRPAPKATGSRRSGGCATWRARSGSTRRSGAPVAPT